MVLAFKEFKTWRDREREIEKIYYSSFAVINTSSEKR
jgi:hypothetical protein